MLRLRQVVRLALIAALVTSATACSSGDSATESSTSGGTAADGDSAPTTGGAAVESTTNDDGATDEAWAAMITTQLTESPMIAQPRLDPVVSATAPISAADGGSISLTLRDETTTATLDIPPGALAQDTTITLVEVNALGADGSPFTGVEVLPEGLVFPPDAVPTLTLQGLEPAGHAVAWDADEVLERSLIIDNDDGSMTVPMFHFSGAGVGSGSSPLPAGEVDRVLDEVRRRIAEAGATGDAVMFDDAINASIADLEALTRGYQRAALKAAAAQCHAHGPVIDQLRIQMIGTRIGADVEVNDELMGAVLVSSANCALNECRNADVTAAGRFLEAAGLIGAGVGTVDPATTETISDAVTDGLLLDCLSFDVTIAGRSDLDFGGLPISEGVAARGVVTAGEPGGALRMDITSRGWEELTAAMLNGMGEGFGAYLGVEFPDDFVDCDPPTYEPGAMATKVTTAPGVEPGTLLPVLAFRPLMATSLLVCNGQTDPNLPAPDPMLLALLSVMPGIVFDEHGATHFFIETEETGLLSWTTSVTLDTSAVGIPGSASLTLQVRATSQQPGSTDVDTEGLTDLFAALSE